MKVAHCDVHGVARAFGWLVAGCPDGYPYCATLDACLLPGRECPSDEPAAGGSDTGEGVAQGGAIGDMPVEPGGGLSSTLVEPTPGQIRCGDSLCDSFDQYCCSGMGGSGNGSGFVTCNATFCPMRRECDEPSDCLGDDVCCFSVVASPPPIMASSCVPPDQCGYEHTYLGCATQADCEANNAPPCVSQPCGGGDIQTCGPITRSSCH